MPDAESQPLELADRLHSSAVRLLRRVRVADTATGLSAPRLSAVAWVVLGGPVTITRLAEAEQVRVPTISRLVKALERGGLIVRRADPDDRRVQYLRATAKGRRLLDAGRRRRVALLAAELARVPEKDRRLLARALDVIARLNARDTVPEQDL